MPSYRVGFVVLLTVFSFSTTCTSLKFSAIFTGRNVDAAFNICYSLQNKQSHCFFDLQLKCDKKTC